MKADISFPIVSLIINPRQSYNQDQLSLIVSLLYGSEFYIICNFVKNRRGKFNFTAFPSYKYPNLKLDEILVFYCLHDVKQTPIKKCFRYSRRYFVTQIQITIIWNTPVKLQMVCYLHVAVWYSNLPSKFFKYGVSIARTSTIYIMTFQIVCSSQNLYQLDFCQCRLKHIKIMISL